MKMVQQMIIALFDDDESQRFLEAEVKRLSKGKGKKPVASGSAKSGSSPRASSGKRVPQTRVRHPYFVAPGRFEVGGIEKSGELYVFKNLKLPMGSWKELEFASYFLMGDPHETLYDWERMTSACQPSGTTPADVYYGLKAVCFLNQNRSDLKGTIAELVEKVWAPDNNSQLHNATMIEYRFGSKALVTPGIGWEEGHPFSTQYEAVVADGLDSELERFSPSNQGISSVLNAILGENDQERCKQVLAWPSNVQKANLIREGQGYDGYKGVSMMVAYGGAILDCAMDPKLLRRARSIRADPNDYRRK